MFSDEEQRKLEAAQEIVGYRFENRQYLLSAITHPSAIEGRPRKYSYERLEFLGDSILGAVVANEAFHRYPDIDEGGLTRIKVNLVAGSHLSKLAGDLGFADVIVFGQSETGTGKRGLVSALENVYEAIVAALFLDGGMDVAREFIQRTLIPSMNLDMAKEPENPKSALQEKLQEDGITPTYRLIDTQGPPHDRTFVAQVFAGEQGLAKGEGRTKKEAESQAAKSTLARIGEFLEQILYPDSREEKAEAKKIAAADKAEAKKQAEAAKAEAKKIAENVKAEAKRQAEAEKAEAKRQAEAEKAAKAEAKRQAEVAKAEAKKQAEAAKAEAKKRAAAEKAAKARPTAESGNPIAGSSHDQEA